MDIKDIASNIFMVLRHRKDANSLLSLMLVNKNYNKWILDTYMLPELHFKRMLALSPKRRGFITGVENLFVQLKINRRLKTKVWKSDLRLLSDILDRMLPNDQEGTILANQEDKLKLIDTMLQTWGEKHIRTSTNLCILTRFFPLVQKSTKYHFPNSENIFMEQLISKASFYDERHNYGSLQNIGITNMICQIKILYLSVKFLHYLYNKNESNSCA